MPFSIAEVGRLKPVLQALLVADHVYTDQVTGKKIVAGIFHQMVFTRKPPRGESEHPADEGVQIQVRAGGHRAGSPFCYISLTDVHGKQEFELRYVDLANDQVLLKAGFGIVSSDPVATAEVALPLPSLPTGTPGTFALELLWNNEPLGSHRIIVRELTTEDGDSDGDS